MLVLPSTVTVTKPEVAPLGTVRNNIVAFHCVIVASVV